MSACTTKPQRCQWRLASSNTLGMGPVRPTCEDSAHLDWGNFLSRSPRGPRGAALEAGHEGGLRAAPQLPTSSNTGTLSNLYFLQHCRSRGPRRAALEAGQGGGRRSAAAADAPELSVQSLRRRATQRPGSGGAHRRGPRLAAAGRCGARDLSRGAGLASASLISGSCATRFSQYHPFNFLTFGCCIKMCCSAGWYCCTGPADGLAAAVLRCFNNGLLGYCWDCPRPEFGRL